MSYERLKRLVENEALPAMIVDLDALERNLRSFADVARGKRMRIATKSLRVPALLRHCLDFAPQQVSGLMCYSVREALYLGEAGFKDLLVAYPSVDAGEIAAVVGKGITLMVDETAHVELIERAAPGAKIPVCLDLDVSYRVAGRHLGVRRSPLRDTESLVRLARRIAQSPVATLDGIMAYEAQIAGVPDRQKISLRAFKALSRRDVERRRAEVVAAGLEIRFFNGGGSGSAEVTALDPSVTEVTIGSGILQSHLFDGYFGMWREPALFFALPVTRHPEPGIVTCHSGGFIASGAHGPDRAPVPFSPNGLVPLPTEGFGEVQTPLRHPAGLEFPLGSPIFFRPAKAGEIAERFSTYLLTRGDQIVDRVPTYRGLGQTFY